MHRHIKFVNLWQACMTPGHDPDVVNLDARAVSIIEFFLNCSILHFIYPLLSVSKGGGSPLLFL